VWILNLAHQFVGGGGATAALSEIFPRLLNFQSESLAAGFSQPAMQNVNQCLLFFW